jgi:hypothetical protein
MAPLSVTVAVLFPSLVIVRHPGITFPSDETSCAICSLSNLLISLSTPLTYSRHSIAQLRQMPKRSSGCFECRKRKVRCDEAKPECTTCVRRGTACPGYRPTQSFILHTFDERTVKPEIIKEDENRYRYANQSGQHSVVQLQGNDRRRLDAPVPHPLSSVAMDRIQHLSNFLSIYLPKWQDNVLPPPTVLILSLPNLPASRVNFLAALDALSAAQLAVSDKSFLLINRTRSLYGTALTQLMKSIADVNKAQEDETLLATYLLALYEVNTVYQESQQAIAKLIGCVGLCRCHQWTWFLLSCARPSSSFHHTWTFVFQHQIEHGDFPWNTLLFGKTIIDN